MVETRIESDAGAVRLKHNKSRTTGKCEIIHTKSCSLFYLNRPNTSRVHRNTSLVFVSKRQRHIYVLPANNLVFIHTCVSLRVNDTRVVVVKKRNRVVKSTPILNTKNFPTSCAKRRARTKQRRTAKDKTERREKSHASDLSTSRSRRQTGVTKTEQTVHQVARLCIA